MSRGLPRLGGGGAMHLARIHGTEEDKVNCPFYFKIGCCRHGDKCSRKHDRPAFSPTILIKHIFRHPEREAELQSLIGQQCKPDGRGDVDAFLDFFEDMYEELSKFGRLDQLVVCDNLGDHMVGHVYAKFCDEEDAADALQVMNGRYYDEKLMEVEYSPVTDFREARCRDFDEGSCCRGGYCNFMHVKPVPIIMIQDLEDEVNEWKRRDNEMRKRRQRERSPSDSSDEGRRRSNHGRRSKDRGGSRNGRSRRSRSRS